MCSKNSNNVAVENVDFVYFYNNTTSEIEKKNKLKAEAFSK